MQDSSVNMVHRDRNNEIEAGVPEPLAILELIVMRNSEERILKNADVLISEGKLHRKLRKPTRWGNCLWSFQKMRLGRKERGKSLIRMNFEKNRIRVWRNVKAGGENLENPAGGYYLDGNRELEEEKKVNDAISEIRIGNLRYKLSQGNGKCSSEGSQSNKTRNAWGA